MTYGELLQLLYELSVTELAQQARVFDYDFGDHMAVDELTKHQSGYYYIAINTLQSTIGENE